MISLAHPHLLWLLAALPVMAALRWWWSARARRVHASTGAAKESLRRRHGGLGALRATLLWCGLAGAVIALAGPRWGDAEQSRRASGADLLIAFDCSRSMLAADLFPDRLRLARRKAIDLMDQAPDLRVALLPFAATATLRCPLTGDHLAVATLLEDCDPDLFPAEAGLQGTAIGTAVRTGLDVLAREPGAGQAILVISDGADPDPKAVEAATAAAKERGVPIYGLFVGDPERSTSVTIDGRQVTMAAERATLDDLATGSGGIAVNATVNDDDVHALATHLGDHLARRPWEERSRTVASERYQWPLAIALLLLSAGWLLPTARRAAPVMALFAALLLPGHVDATEPWRELAPIAEQAVHDPAGARAALEQLLLEHPYSAAAHYNLGCLQLADDATSAARHLEAATRSSQIELAADAWHNLALARLKLGQLDEALAAAEQALQRRPEVADFTRTRDELRRAVLARDDAKRLAAEEAAKRLRLASTTLPLARLGEDYRAGLAAAGGTAPYRFAAPTLPDGLALDADGALHGTPTKVGPHKIDVTVSDAANGSATGKASLEVLPAPAITTEILPEAIATIPYRAEIGSVGLIAPTWQVSGLPASLTAITIGDRAVIGGATTAQGTTTLRVTATDADGIHRATRDLQLIVGDSFAPAESELPPATAFAGYEYRLTVRGRPMAYRWIHQAEGGITIAADGSVSGAPPQAGRLALHATIAAEDGRTRAVELTLPVNPPPVIEEEARITLTRGQAVDRALRVTGGTPPYRWSGHGGPAGVRIDADGHLRGSPSQLGEAEMTLACEDRWKAGTELKVTVVVEERKDDQQDQQNQDQQQQQQDQAQQQQQQQQNQQQQQQNQQQDPQSGEGPESGDQQQQQQQAQDQPKPGEDPKPGQQAERQDGTAQRQPKGDQQQRPAPSAAEQAADRWIEALPADDHDALRLQLLQGAPAPVSQGENPW